MDELLGHATGAGQGQQTADRHLNSDGEAPERVQAGPAMIPDDLVTHILMKMN